MSSTSIIQHYQNVPYEWFAWTASIICLSILAELQTFLLFAVLTNFITLAGDNRIRIIISLFFLVNFEPALTFITAKYLSIPGIKKKTFRTTFYQCWIIQCKIKVDVDMFCPAALRLFKLFWPGRCLNFIVKLSLLCKFLSLLYSGTHLFPLCHVGLYYEALSLRICSDGW